MSDAALRAAAVACAALTVHSWINARLLRRPPGVAAARAAPEGRTAREQPEFVSVLVPARDEADRIARCVTAILASRNVALEVVLLDDESSDGTAQLVLEAGGGDIRLRVLPGRPLPAGWLGKSNACQQLADAASGQVLVFVDADVTLAPDGLAATVALLSQSGLDFVCPYPRQIADTPGERLVQPLLQWSWLTFLPLRLAETAASPALTAANGQIFACTASAYRRAGGHAAVRGAVLEDLELARAFKRAGLRGGVADGTAVAECRMYAGWPALREGYTKSLWAAFGSPAGAAVAGASLAWLYLLPPVAAAVRIARGPRDGRQLAAPLAGYAAAVAGRLLTARATGGRSGDAWAHPLSVAALLMLLAGSVRARRRGRLRWRGRSIA